MSYTIEFDAAHKRIAIVVAPPISEYDALKCFREVRAHPDFRADYGILVNLLAADRSLDVTEAEHLGGAMKYLFPGHRIALLRRTPTPTLAFDALRVAATSKTEVHIFSELGAAEAWLAS
jgi:hypothetical protein